VVNAPGLLARGPWDPADIEVSWREDEFSASPAAVAAADAALDELRERGSPSHDGLAGRLATYEVDDGKLRLELQRARWSLRLSLEDAVQSLSVLCVVRDADGRWLAVEVDENPAHTMSRELLEEWSVAPERLQIEALVCLPSQVVLLVGQAWLATGATVTPDAEHDDFAWWPADVAQWPDEADEPLRRMAALLRHGR
jgi:hypothetical protein